MIQLGLPRQTNGVDNGIAVISYYGISASNCDSDKRINERYFSTLRRHTAHHRKKPIFLGMDANIDVEKSEVLQAMKKDGWKDISSCLGDTFRKGFKEKKDEGTTVWNRLGEETFRKKRAEANTKAQKMGYTSSDLNGLSKT